MFGLLKNYMPRGIYARAALILALPFLALQVIVSVVFIQDHFEDVTRQMVNAQAIVMTHVLETAEVEGLMAGKALADPLGVALDVGTPMPPGNPKNWYDISGFTIISRLGEIFALEGVDLSNRRYVRVWITEGATTYEMGFDRNRMSARNPHQLLVLMIVVGIFMIAIAFIFLRNQLRPIRRLARAADAFGRGRSEPYSPAGAAEVRAAGAAFLDMRARIERQIEQRTLLLSGVSHDLRTPLTRMRLALGVMDPSEDVKDLRHDVDDMGQMIDAFLDFACVGAGEEPVETDLHALMTDCFDDAQRTGATLELGAPLPHAVLKLRPIGLKRSVANLISNAARYGTKVRLTVELLDRSVRIRVEDNGPGIAPEDREAVVRPFTRLDEARNQNRGGSVGLGLAIASDTARRHGGTLRLTDSGDLGGLCADLVLAR